MNNDMNLSLDWLDFGKMNEIVEIASQIILQIYLNDELFMKMSIENKVDNSPLTIADKKANDFICRELRGLYPDIPIISEENKNDEWEVRRKYTWAWLVDPLDGTKEFIKRNGEFTVNIGLVYEGRPVAGFVGVPAKGQFYWGYVIRGDGGGGGGGAWKREINSAKGGDLITDLREIAIANTKEIGIRIVASRSHMDERTDKFIQTNYLDKGENIELINVGSSIKILWIAENKADVYPRIAPTMEWDTCAAHAILNACGGKIIVHDGQGEELSYNKANLLNPYFIAKLKNR